MSSAPGLRFGPLDLVVAGAPLPGCLDAHVGSVDAASPTVQVAVVDALPKDTPRAHADAGFALRAEPGGWAIAVRGDAGPSPWLAAFCEIVAREAPAADCALLHAGAVALRDGVALLVGPPGVGKTTAVRAAGSRAFASNAVLAEAGGQRRVWAMPFNRDLEPALEAKGPRPLRAVAFVRRSDVAGIECLAGSAATVRLMAHVMRPRGDDPAPRLRSEVALRVLLGVPAVVLGMPRGPSYLVALDGLSPVDPAQS